MTKQDVRWLRVYRCRKCTKHKAVEALDGDAGTCDCGNDLTGEPFEYARDLATD